MTLNFCTRLSNSGSFVVFAIIFLGFLSVLSTGVLFICTHATNALENRLWISKARLQSETSLLVSGLVISSIPPLPSSDPEDLFLNKEQGFRSPEFTLPNYLFKTETLLYSVIDWGTTRCIFSAEYENDNGTFTVRKIKRL